MPMAYKIDVLKALRDAGYNTNTLRQRRLISESTIQKLREGRPINWTSMEQICSLLNCQPGDFVEYVPHAEQGGNHE